VPERNPDPDPDPLVTRLTRTGNETEDMVALVGYIGPLQGGFRRIYADHHLQRWLEIPDGKIVDSVRIDTDDELGGRTVIWVRRDAMTTEVFHAGVLEAMESYFAEEHGGMSTWPLVPDNRLVAADLLGLLPSWERGEYEEGA
jgi:hypothetical protein